MSVGRPHRRGAHPGRERRGVPRTGRRWSYPTGRDRVLGVVLSGTTGAALLAVVSVLTDTPALRDVALAVVALATVIAVARVRADAGETR